MDKLVVAAQNGTWVSATPTINLTAASYPSDAPLHQEFDTQMDTGDTASVIVRNATAGATNWKWYENVAFTSGTPDVLSFASATLVDEEGTISNSDSVETYSVMPRGQGYGTTFPVAADFMGGVIPDGFQFYRQDRQVLYIYEQAWVPLQMFNGATLYVESGETGDGWGTGSDAAGTIADALAEVPDGWSGEVIINVEAGTFSGNINIRISAGTGGSMVIQGTLTSVETGSSATLVQGTGATQGTLTHANVDGAYADKLLYLETDEDYRIVDSVSSTTATIVGTWDSATTQNYTLYDWGTVFTDYIRVYGSGISIKYIEFSSDLQRAAGSGCSASWFECHFENGFYGYDGAFYNLYRCLSDSYSAPFRVYTGSSGQCRHSKFKTNAGSGSSAYLEQYAFVNLGYGNVFDGANGTSARGVRAVTAAFARFYSTAALGYSRLRNTGVSGAGLLTATGALVESNSLNVYSNNTTDEDIA